ncbi:MAG: UDP-N-acetylmuramate dehydrogenase [Patescibacteria group bacterium]|nr:MAG: UDP-N-acetylmuramate dehydrogenase [Patescibacteria group bacterium]
MKKGCLTLENSLGLGVRRGVFLAPYTTFKIGGPADFFCEVQTSRELVKAVRWAQGLEIPYFILGRGSNILVSDEGFRGLIIKNHIKGSELEIGDEGPETGGLKIEPRLEWMDEKEFYVFEDLSSEYDGRGRSVFVKAGSGWELERLALALFDRDIVGLEYFAGIPGTVGGAVYGNSHGGTKFLGEYVAGAEVLTEEGEIARVTQEFFQFDYDYSSLKDNGGIVLAVVLQLRRGDGDRARVVFDTWKERKIRQPKRSAGCIFQNLDKAEQRRLGFPTNSVGWILDQVLQFKGVGCGDARVSNYHAAFIVNAGRAKASDVKSLVELCKEKAQSELGLKLREEIIYVGFYEG